MSFDAIKAVKAAFQSDKRLYPVDKVILMEWAWNTPEHGSAPVIRFKTYARNLGLSVGGVRKSVLRLLALKYLKAVAVQVVAGSALKEGAPRAPSVVSDGVHPVHPVGAPSAPQRVHPVHPIKRKRKKDTREALSVTPEVCPVEPAVPVGSDASRRASSDPAQTAGGLPVAALGWVVLSGLSRFQRSALVRPSGNVLVNGRYVFEGSPERLRVSKLLALQDA